MIYLILIFLVLWMIVILIQGRIVFGWFVRDPHMKLFYRDENKELTLKERIKKILGII